MVLLIFEMIYECSEILVVGQYAHDQLIQDSSNTIHALGGPPAYMASVLHPLDADYSLIAKVGGDFKYFQQVYWPPIVSPDSDTTSFVNDGSLGERYQVLEALCEPIYPEEIRISAKVGIIAGMFNDILPETVLRLRELCNYIVGDVQGLIRFRNKDNHVGNLHLEDTVYADCLDCFDYLQVSSDDVGYVQVDVLRKQTTIIVTYGKEGCLIHDESGAFRVPAYKVSVRETTGAGDCFLAGFAYGLSKNLSSRRAAELGNFCGALAVQQIGVPILKRADFQLILDRVLDDTIIELPSDVMDAACDH